uniref:Tudor domain containing 7 a n=1 Tax=Sparus aurata TaxID=8175 RepID=A0A671UWF1_SPAAU
MSDSESIKKMLRSVLQSSKTGVSVSSLQSEYRGLCGEFIPLKKLGYSKLEDYLRSIPSVVRLEYCMGEIKCFAAVCQETAHIAELVARQKSSKKSGRSQLVNCRMRFKPSNPYMLNVRPRSSLRQPSSADASNWIANYSRPHRANYRGCSASGDYSLYNEELVQSRISQLLQNYCSGLWLSKLPEVYSEMFSQKLHPQTLTDVEKWTDICVVVKPCGTNRTDCLIYPPLPPSPSTVPRHNTTPPTSATDSGTTLNPKQNATPLAPPPQIGSDILPLLKVTFSPTSDSAPCPPSKSSTVVVSAEVRQRIKELLSKNSHGLWAHALPKLFMETYKVPFPDHILDNLSLLLDICTVEYPIPHNKKKAILYICNTADMEATDSQQFSRHPLPSGLEVVGAVLPPPLVPPSEQYPSVLITDAKSSNTVTIRYVGESYSNAQEAMEEAMHSFYNQSSSHHTRSNPVVGQLVAVRGEDGDELARAQVMEVMGRDKVKVYYLDHGFSVETSVTNLLELHQDFLSLPFQATNVRLAGLETFSSHPLVLSSLDKLAVGKILLMEALEPCQQGEMPVVVLYDTSQDDDVNINSTCLKALQDKTMNNPLTVNATYQDVCVTDVCADGIIHCQLPSRGAARLSKLLEETEAIFASQVTSESLVSRPFSGKFCLARHKGKCILCSFHGSMVLQQCFVFFLPVSPCFCCFLQATKCRLADLAVPQGDWSPEAVLWVKEVVLRSEDCKMKIFKLEQHKGDWLVYMYLFIGTDSQQLEKSINYQLAQSELWHKLTTRNNNNTITSSNSSMDTGITPGQNMDVFVPVACHPGHFVLQQWQDLHKLVVLMGEMILYYNQTWQTNTATDVKKGDVYAAKIDKNWHRVQVKGILTNGLVSVYELDHGKHELVQRSLLQPLIEEFRQLPFQAISAQLAGMTQQQWTEEAAMLFRNHVENHALVAQVESVQELSEVKGELWERRLTVYLVDTTVEARDLWIHSIIADISGDLSSAA